MTAPDHLALTFNKTLAGRERPDMTTPSAPTQEYAQISGPKRITPRPRLTLAHILW
jgi:hypothetical protein